MNRSTDIPILVYHPTPPYPSQQGNMNPAASCVTTVEKLFLSATNLDLTHHIFGKNIARHSQFPLLFLIPYLF